MEPSPPIGTPLVVTIQTPQRREHYMSQCVLGLSVTQLIIGALCIVFQGVLIGIEPHFYFAGSGIWAGVLYMLTGSFGIVSSMRKTKCFIVTFLTLAIISAVIAISFFLSAVTQIAQISNHDIIRQYDVVIGIGAVLVTLAVTQAVLAIVSSALGCHGVCCHDQNQAVVMENSTDST